jgi:hypothetical protein
LLIFWFNPRGKRLTSAKVMGKLPVWNLQKLGVPDEERTKRVTAHDGIEQKSNLILLPNEIPLKVW